MGNSGCCAQVLTEITTDIRPKHDPHDELKPFIALSSDENFSSDENHSEINQIASSKPKKRYKPRHKLRPKPSESQSVIALKEELNEIEIKLKQQIHETKVLKQENHALRAENSILKSLAGGSVNDIYSVIHPVSPITLCLTTGDLSGDRLSPLVDPLPPLSFDGITSNSFSFSPSACLMDIEEEPLFMFATRNEPCSCIESCLSIKRITKALEWYSLFMSDGESFLDKINECEYGEYLFTDWEHILNVHSKDECEAIVTLMDTEHVCDGHKCDALKRYMSKQTETNSVMNIMYVIHCHFMHLDVW